MGLGIGFGPSLISGDWGLGIRLSLGKMLPEKIFKNIYNKKQKLKKYYRKNEYKKCNKITKSRIFEISKVHLYSSKKCKYIYI